MSYKSNTYYKDDENQVSACIKLKDTHFCGYCSKPYKISGLYSHMVTCSKNYKMTAEQRAARKKCQNNSSQTYNKKPEVKLQNYRGQLKTQVEKDKASHEALTKLTELNK